MSGAKPEEKTKETHSSAPQPKPKNPWQMEKGEGAKQALKAFSFLGSIGIYLIVFVGICIFLGYEADISFGLGHTGRLIGIVFGFPAALYSIYRQLKRGSFF